MLLRVVVVLSELLVPLLPPRVTLLVSARELLEFLHQWWCCCGWQLDRGQLGLGTLPDGAKKATQPTLVKGS
jgi:hypothetical protein